MTIRVMNAIAKKQKLSREITSFRTDFVSTEAKTGLVTVGVTILERHGEGQFDYRKEQHIYFATVTRDVKGEDFNAIMVDAMDVATERFLGTAEDKIEKMKRDVYKPAAKKSKKKEEGVEVEVEEEEESVGQKRRRLEFSEQNIDPFQIFIKGLSGKTHTLLVFPYTTVKECKQMIALKECVSWDQQNVIFAGKYLKNSKTLDGYNIQKESTLHLILWLNGC